MRLVQIVLRSILLVGVWTFGGIAHGQMILQKHLVIGLAGGGGITSTQSNWKELRSSAIASSGVRFSFSYAFNERWSLGGQYLRVGSVKFPGPVDRIRFTNYMIEGTYRFINSDRHAVEILLGAGITSMTLRPVDELLPYDAVGPVANAGIRYLFLINETIGLFAAFDHTQAPDHDVTHKEYAIDGYTIRWNSQRLTGGAFLRF